MSRKIDVGGRQGRDPQPSTWIADLDERAGVEVEKRDLGPITPGERLVLWLILAVGIGGIGSLVVSCAA